MPSTDRSIRGIPRQSIDALRRLRAEPAPRSQLDPACEFCNLTLAEPHEHVLQLHTRQLACACTACALLFDHDRAMGVATWKRLPRDHRPLPHFDFAEHEWAELAIPIALAFLSIDSVHGRVDAVYPSPAGAVTARIEPAVWNDLTQAHPELSPLAPDVEALLVNRLDSPHQAVIVPLDRAYRLVAQVRRAWSGFSGGPSVQHVVADFIAKLAPTAGDPARA